MKNSVIPLMDSSANIPVIDIGALCDGEKNERSQEAIDAVAKAISHACRNVGELQHSVNDATRQLGFTACSPSLCPSSLPSLSFPSSLSFTYEGFFYVKNHGVPSHVRAALFDTGKEFFKLPLDVKRSIHMDKSPYFRGYFQVQYRRASASACACVGVEATHCGSAHRLARSSPAGSLTGRKGCISLLSCRWSIP